MRRQRREEGEEAGKERNRGGGEIKKERGNEEEKKRMEIERNILKNKKNIKQYDESNTKVSDSYKIARKV